MSALSKWQSLYSIVLDDAVELFDHDKKKPQNSFPRLKTVFISGKKIWYVQTFMIYVLDVRIFPRKEINWNNSMQMETITCTCTGKVFQYFLKAKNA